MCDPELIAAILEELGYFDEKKEGKEEEGHENERNKDNLKNSGGEEK